MNQDVLKNPPIDPGDWEWDMLRKEWSLFWRPPVSSRDLLSPLKSHCTPQYHQQRRPQHTPLSRPNSDRSSKQQPKKAVRSTVCLRNHQSKPATSDLCMKFSSTIQLSSNTTPRYTTSIYLCPKKFAPNTETEGREPSWFFCGELTFSIRHQESFF